MATASYETRLLVGKLNVSCIGTSFASDNQRVVHDRTPFCERNKIFITGRRSHTATVGAMFDDAAVAGSYWAEMVDNYTNDTLLPVTVGVAGVAHGAPLWLVEAFQVGYKPTSDADGTVDASYEFGITGPAGFGYSLHTVTSPVIETGDDTNLDGAASSDTGGIAHLHCTDAAGTTPTCDVIIEHSVDGSTSWATLVTFTQLEDEPATERVVVAEGTTIRRYLRASYTVAGTDPSYTLAVAFART